MAKKRATKPTHRERRPPIGELQKRLVIMSLLRHDELFRTFKDQLRPDHFAGPYDKPLSLAWRTVLDFFKEHAKLPDESQLFAAVQQQLRERSDLTEAEENYLADDIIAAAYQLSEDAIDPPVVRRWVSQIMHDALSEQLRNQLEGSDVVVDLPELLREHFEKASTISALKSDAAVKPFEITSVDQWEKESPKLVRTKTGCEFLDAPMRGGVAAKEVYLLGAPYQGGKTLLGVQLANNNAKRELGEWYARGKKGRIRLTYIISWEEEIESLRLRLLSNWANVPRELIEDGDASLLSTNKSPKTLKDYEQERYASSLSKGLKVLGERERLNQAYRGINRTIRIIDFSGGRPELAELAADGARGAADAIASSQLAEGRPGVSLVILDHANAAADTRILYHGLTASSEKTPILSVFPRGVKQFIASVYDCPVWLMHQLDTKSQDRGAGFIPGTTAWANSKDMSQYANFSWIMGKQNLDGLCVMVSTKHRRTAPILPRVLRVNGRFCSVADAGSSFVLRDGQITSRDDADRVVGPDEAGLGSRDTVDEFPSVRARQLQKVPTDMGV